MSSPVIVARISASVAVSKASAMDEILAALVVSPKLWNTVKRLAWRPVDTIEVTSDVISDAHMLLWGPATLGHIGAPMGVAMPKVAPVQ